MPVIAASARARESAASKFLFFLHVLGIGQRQAFHDRQQAQKITKHAPGLGAGQLCGIRVALLGHHRTARRVGIGQLHETEPVAAPVHDLLGKPRDMNHADRCGRHEFEREIPIRDGVERVCNRPVKAEVFGNSMPVDREGGARQCSGAKRQFVQARARIGEPATIPSEHFHIGEQVVPEGQRLRRLQMGEAGHDRASMGLCLVEKGVLQALQLHIQRVDLVADPESEIGRHLIVARACRVQPPGRIADQLPQPGLDVHVDVFEGRGETEFTALDLSRNRV
jgi:hypothetical protein